MRKRNGRTPKAESCRPAVTPGWKHAALCVLVMALSAVPFHAQTKANSQRGSGPKNDCRPTWGAPCGVQQIAIGDIPALPKPVSADDEKCLPWNVSKERDTTSSVTSLKVPSKARREFEKACNAYHKKKFSDAEQHLRGALEKFQNYSAAWVMLAVVLDEQNKVHEARDACSRAAKTDTKYLPAYLCAAEFSTRNQEWGEILNLANVALGLNSEGDGYVHYYRAMAYFHLNNLVDAQMSALKAAEIDVNHNYLPLYFLLAQIYDVEGDKVNAAIQLRQVLKHRPNQQQEYAAKQYLAKLDAAKAAQAPAETIENADVETLARGSADRTSASMADLEKPNENWISEDIDNAVPPVAAGVACSLPAVLDGAGQRILELVQNVDRFTATEILTHRAIDHSGRMGPPIAVKSNYLVSFTEGQSGYLRVDEFRNGSLSRESFPTHVATIGTPSLVLIFHPRYAKNFRMECEGLGEWYGHPAWQVRFEQRTDRANHTLSFNVDRTDYSVNLKGRAWILADSFQVARLETDLEQSVPKIRLRRFHQSIEYRPVESSSSNSQLWLPSGAELYMDFQGHRFYRELAFTDFRLFSVGMQYHTSDPKEATAVPQIDNGTVE